MAHSHKNGVGEPHTTDTHTRRPTLQFLAALASARPAPRPLPSSPPTPPPRRRRSPRRSSPRKATTAAATAAAAAGPSTRRGVHRLQDVRLKVGVRLIFARAGHRHVDRLRILRARAKRRRPLRRQSRRRPLVRFATESIDASPRARGLCPFRRRRRSRCLRHLHRAGRPGLSA